MGTARDFDRLLKEELNIHAAWLPIINTFDLGDYGLISDGVLVKAGNIKADFGISFTRSPGPASGMQLNFASKGTTFVRVAGDAPVSTFPQADIAARLTVAFEHERSFLAKAKLTMSQIANVNEVALQLAAEQLWDRKWRVVSAIYNGTDCAIISSKSAKSKIELSGKAKALQGFELGSVSTDIQVSTKQEIGLDIVGRTGVIGLEMFKLGWFGGHKVLGPGEKPALESSSDWSPDDPDDV